MIINPCKDSKGVIIEDGDLGGTHEGGDPNTFYPELWDYIIKKYDVKSFLDIGCGLGYAQKFIKETYNIGVTGVEGSSKVAELHQDKDNLIIHDMRSPIILGTFDFVWSCEFLEHIDEVSVDILVNTIISSTRKILLVTAADVGQDGYHHVNCQPQEYWIKKFEKKLKFCAEETEIARKLCPDGEYDRTHSYFFRTGMVFKCL